MVKYTDRNSPCITFCTRYLSVPIACIDYKKHLFKNWLYLTFMCHKVKNLIQSRTKTSIRFLYARLKQLTSEKRFVILLGDFNIFATDQDLCNPSANMWNEYCMKTAKKATLSSYFYRLVHRSLCVLLSVKSVSFIHALATLFDSHEVFRNNSACTRRWWYTASSYC
jgi:exonuclease III